MTSNYNHYLSVDNSTRKFNIPLALKDYNTMFLHVPNTEITLNLREKRVINSTIIIDLIGKIIIKKGAICITYLNSYDNEIENVIQISDEIDEPNNNKGIEVSCMTNISLFVPMKKSASLIFTSYNTIIKLYYGGSCLDSSGKDMGSIIIDNSEICYKPVLPGPSTFLRLKCPICSIFINKNIISERNIFTSIPCSRCFMGY